MKEKYFIRLSINLREWSSKEMEAQLSNTCWTSRESHKNFSLKNKAKEKRQLNWISTQEADFSAVFYSSLLNSFWMTELRLRTELFFFLETKNWNEGEAQRTFGIV